MTVKMGGATVNGMKPIVSETVHDYGNRGAARPAPFKDAQIAEGGATDPGTGKKVAPTPSKPDLTQPGDGQNSTASTAESMKKRLAGRMYPSSTGLQEFMP